MYLITLTLQKTMFKIWLNFIDGLSIFLLKVANRSLSIKQNAVLLNSSLLASLRIETSICQKIWRWTKPLSYANTRCLLSLTDWLTSWRNEIKFSTIQPNRMNASFRGCRVVIIDTKATYKVQHIHINSNVCFYWTWILFCIEKFANASFRILYFKLTNFGYWINHNRVKKLPVYRAGVLTKLLRKCLGDNQAIIDITRNGFHVTTYPASEDVPQNITLLGAGAPPCAHFYDV